VVRRHTFTSTELRRLLGTKFQVYHGMVEIGSIAREPGRSKVAVAALQPRVDPVGACVHHVRIQAIVRELNDESRCH
jgi:N utilization substance protein A